MDNCLSIKYIEHTKFAVLESNIGPQTTKIQFLSPILPIPNSQAPTSNLKLIDEEQNLRDKIVLGTFLKLLPQSEEKLLMS